jgi:FkbM family methyltransferase
VLDRLPFLYRAWRYRVRVDPAEIRVVLSALRPGACAVDVGAHKGGYLYWMRRAVGPAGRVFAFEPQPELAGYLRSRVRDLGFDNVVVEEVALSDASGRAVLEVPEGGPACGATLEPGLPGARRPVTVAVQTLDAYFASRPELRIALVKCDAEGHELRIFRGAERILREHRPVLLFECEAQHNRRQRVEDVFRFLEGLGYSGQFVRGRRLFPLPEFTPALQADPRARGYVNNFVFRPGPAPG